MTQRIHPYTNAAVHRSPMPRERKPKPVQVDDLEMVEVRIGLTQRIERLWKLRHLKSRDRRMIRESIRHVATALRKFSVINTQWEVAS